MDLTLEQREALTAQGIENLIPDSMKRLPVSGLQLYSL
jgi:hypothetical protein